MAIKCINVTLEDLISQYFIHACFSMYKILAYTSSHEILFALHQLMQIWGHLQRKSGWLSKFFKIFK